MTEIISCHCIRDNHLLSICHLNCLRREHLLKVFHKHSPALSSHGVTFFLSSKILSTFTAFAQRTFASNHIDFTIINF